MSRPVRKGVNACELWILMNLWIRNLVLWVLSCVLVWYPTSTVASTVARFRDYLIWDLASNLVAELHLWFCCHWVSLSYPSSAIGFAGCLIGSCFGVPAQAYLGSQLLGSIPQEVALGNWMPRLLWMRRYYKYVEDFLHINMFIYIYVFICIHAYGMQISKGFFIATCDSSITQVHLDQNLFVCIFPW